MISGDTFQTADSHRLLLHAPPPAGGFTGPVTDATEDARKDITLPVDHVGVIESPLGDQPDVFGNVGMRGTAPLAIHYLVEIIRIRSVGPFH